MQWIMLCCATGGLFAQNVLMKAFTNGKRLSLFSVVLYNLLLACGALVLFFLVQAATGTAVAFHLPTVLYALAFSACFTGSIFFSTLAFACGPMAVSALFIQYSLILPTLFGVVFCRERPGVLAGIGVLLLFVSLLLTESPKRAAGGRRWLLYILLAFVGNGMCSVLQKLHQLRYPGQYRFELLECSMLGVILLSALLLIPLRRTAAERPAALCRSAARYALPAGLCNGIVNYLVVVLVNRMAASVIFPVITAGGVVLTFLVSQLVYREKLRVGQYVGYALGVLSVVLLNL